jgi:hypothetical protein
VLLNQKSIKVEMDVKAMEQYVNVRHRIYWANFASMNCMVTQLSTKTSTHSSSIKVDSTIDTKINYIDIHYAIQHFNAIQAYYVLIIEIFVMDGIRARRFHVFWNRGSNQIRNILIFHDLESKLKPLEPKNFLMKTKVI